MEGDEVVLGKITRPHGIRGEVKVLPLSGWPDSFRNGERLRLTTEGEPDRIITMEALRKQGNAYIIKIAGIDNRNEAERLRGSVVFVPKDRIPPLPPDSYYVDELIGLTVLSTDDVRIGRMEDVLKGGAHDIYVIRDNGKEILVPAVKAFIKRIDLESQIMTIEVIEGLLD